MTLTEFNSYKHMPIKRISERTVPVWLKGGHLQTIYPQLFRWLTSDYQRERINTPDGDFLDLDWMKRDSETLIIVNHGLEGDSNGRYIKGIANYMSDNGQDVLCWNYRGRSGEPNLKLQSYHAGFINDLQFLVEKYSPQYRNVILIGFSLGGCITLNYLGRKASELPSQVRAGVAISTPLDLSSCSSNLDRFENTIYRKYFLRKLSKSVDAKAETMPKEVSREPMKSIRKIREFDEVYTAPINGFDSAETYYTYGSPFQQLSKIKLPVLIFNAANDPFLSSECFPKEIPDLPENVHYHISSDGGHVGFSGTDKTGAYFSERYALRFIREQLAK